MRHPWGLPQNSWHIINLNDTVLFCFLAEGKNTRNAVFVGLHNAVLIHRLVCPGILGYTCK
jgi:hypothetical protein